MTTSKTVGAVVETMIAERGVNESGELPEGWAREIAEQLDVPCDEQLVQYASEAYAHAASR